MFKNRSIKLSLVKNKDAEDETPRMDPDALIAIAKETGKILVGGICIVIAAGFLAKAGSEILVANLTP